MNTYIEIKEIKTDKPIHRMDVTGKGERTIERVESGVNINLNHSEYYTEVVESETNLQTGDLN